MERILHVNHMDIPFEDPREGQYIYLKNGHLIIESTLADQTISNTQQIYAVFYPNLKAILIAPDSNKMFKQAHEVIMLFVKIKNNKGDRSISIQEFMADHEIDDTCRDLKFLSAPGMDMIHISI
jgi:hypothetical protein